MAYFPHLDQSLLDLQDAFSDFRRAPIQSAPSLLVRVVSIFDSEPLASLLSAHLSPPDFEGWYAAASATVSSYVGSGHLDWPVDRADRVAVQIALTRAIADGRIAFLDFGMKFFLTSGHVNVLPLTLWNRLFGPMLRDLERLAKQRYIAQPLAAAIRALPGTGDSVLDQLLDAASAAFADPSPRRQRDAMEKLWDAWERLKSVQVPGNKQASTAQLLDAAASEPKFRQLLEAEARALTDIGNAFHIRHFETDKMDIKRAEHTNYLFHRLFAFIQLLVLCGKQDE